MIAESEAELASSYRPEVRHALSPAQLMVAGVDFLSILMEKPLLPETEDAGG